MSSHNAQSVIKSIPIPALNSSQYGVDVREAFNVIDENFKKISYQAFSQGEPGENMYAHKLTIQDLYTHNTESPIITTDNGYKLHIGGLYDKLLKSISSLATQSELTTVDNVSWEDNILPGGIQMQTEIILFYSYNPSIHNSLVKTKIISSTVFSFLDARFNRDLSRITTHDYITIKDVSCAVIIQNTGDEITWVSSQLYPTLYYKEGVGFCWMMNNIETGLLAQGPKGDSGNSAQIYMVVGTKDPKVDDKMNIFGVFDSALPTNSPWISWETFIKDNPTWSNIRNSISIIFEGFTSDDVINIDGSKGYWISRILIENPSPDTEDIPKAYAICTDQENVGNIITNDVVKSGFDDISWRNDITSGIKGIYIPATKSKVGPEDYFHTLAALPEQGASAGNVNPELVLMPIKGLHGTIPFGQTGDFTKIPTPAEYNFSILYNKLRLGNKASVGTNLTVNNDGEFACGTNNVSVSNQGDHGGNTIFTIGNPIYGITTPGRPSPKIPSNVIDVRDNDDVYIKWVGGYSGSGNILIDRPKSLQEAINYPDKNLQSIYFYPAFEQKIHLTTSGKVGARIYMDDRRNDDNINLLNKRKLLININSYTDLTGGDIIHPDQHVYELEFCELVFNKSDYKDGYTWEVSLLGTTSSINKVKLIFDLPYYFGGLLKGQGSTDFLSSQNNYQITYVNIKTDPRFTYMTIDINTPLEFYVVTLN